MKSLCEKSKILEKLITKALEKVPEGERVFSIESVRLFDDSLDKAYSSGLVKKASLDAFFIERIEKQIRGTYLEGAVGHHKLHQGYGNSYKNVWTDSYNGNIGFAYNINDERHVITLIFFGDHPSNPLYRM